MLFLTIFLCGLSAFLLTILIVLLTVLLSSPFGGILWRYYDMKAGYFPTNWLVKMINQGFAWGLEMGWLVVALPLFSKNTFEHKNGT